MGTHMLREPRAASVCQGVALGLLLLLLVIAPLPLGSDTLWAQCGAFIVVSAAALLWIVAGVVRGALYLPRSHALIFVGLFFLIGIVQLVPLPDGVLGVVSTQTLAFRARGLGLEGAASSAPISLAPYATLSALYRYGACAMMFVLLASLARSRKAVGWAAALLLAAGLFQVIYAMLEHGHGGQYVFWVEKTFYRDTFTGTFFNKNHFAGLLEMLLPLSAALVLAVRRSENPMPAPTLSQRLVQSLGAPSVQKRIAVSVPAILLGVGLAMSLSRSGVFCSVAALAALTIFGLLSRGRSSGALLASVVVGVIGVAALFVAGPIISSFSRALSGRMFSLYARKDMTESALHLIADFPLAGVGLGALGQVFGYYQSANLGNVHIRYLANDWAQIACEAGLVGAVLVAAGLLVFAVSTLRTALRGSSRYGKWVAAGCLMGAFAMTLHSVTDFNLTRTLSNALIFAALLAIAHCAAHLRRETGSDVEPRGHLVLECGPLALRIVLGLALIAPLVLLAKDRANAALGEVRYNWYLHFSGKETGLYYFLKLPDLPRDAKARAALHLRDALHRDPGNPDYLHALGRSYLEQVDEMVKEKARLMVYEALPGIRDNPPEELDELVSALRQTARDALAAQIIAHGDRPLERAETALRRAVSLAPADFNYHLSLAECLRLRAAVEKRARPASSAWQAYADGARTELDRSVFFAKNTPFVLFQVAQAILQEAVYDGKGRRVQDIDAAVALLRRSIYAAPRDLAPKAYELLDSASLGNHRLVAATPHTLRAYRELCRFLWEKRAPAEPQRRQNLTDLLAALDQLEGLLGEVRPEAFVGRLAAAASETPGRQEPTARSETVPPSFSWSSEDASTVELQLDIAEKRAGALALLGLWPQRTRELDKYRRLVAERVLGELEQARGRLDRGDYALAMTVYSRALAEAPHDIDALLGMAHVTLIPYVRERTADKYRPLACLLRIVLNHDALTREQGRRIATVLDELRPTDAEDQAVKRFVQSVSVILQPSDPAPLAVAMQGLHGLATSTDDAVTRWRQRHLVWFYLALGYRKSGDPEKAAEMYTKVLGFVPEHARTLNRLVAMAPDRSAAEQYRSKLATLTPEQPASVLFDGRVRFLGYSVVPPQPGQTGKGSLKCYWEFLEPVHADYAALTYYVDYLWRVLWIDSRSIAPPGGLYPTDLARAGEVIVEERPLNRVPGGAVYLGITLYARTPPNGEPKHLPRDGGRGLARFLFVPPKVTPPPG